MPSWRNPFKKKPKEDTEDRNVISSKQSLTQRTADADHQIHRNAETALGHKTEQHATMNSTSADVLTIRPNADVVRKRARQPATTSSAPPNPSIEGRAQEPPTTAPIAQQAVSSSSVTNSQYAKTLRPTQAFSTSHNPSRTVPSTPNLDPSSALRLVDHTAETHQRAIRDQAVGCTEATGTNDSLWDRAYDTLSKEKNNPIADYEVLLSRALVKVHAEATTSPSKTEDESDVANQIPADPVVRRQQLQTIANLGLKHMEEKKISTTVLGHEIVLQDVVAGVAGAVEWGEDYIKDAVKDLPYASIVMAGVSLVLPLLKNPTADEAANQDGFSYVTSQMRYYVTLEDLLLPEHIGVDRKDEFAGRLVDLYKLIIDFQVRSILRFYRSRTKNFLRGTVKYDGWDKKVGDIQKADADFVTKLETAISASGLQKLAELVQSTKASHKALDDLVNLSQNLLRFAKKLDRRMSDADNRACLESLRINPRDEKARIELEKGGLFKDSYCWVLNHIVFQHWRDDDQGQLLWIKGDPGKGKTMLLCGIIDELIKKSAHNANISFFFCQATYTEINNATAVLRGLIFMLVKQQPILMPYLRESYDEGKDRFQGRNAWIVLLKILNKILEDPKLRNTYLIIDALDECETDLDLLLNLIADKSSAYPHVKWIVSSRNWPSIGERLDKVEASMSLELNKDTISAAVVTYIQHKVAQLAANKGYDPTMRDAIERHLLSNANDTFLWVALVCEEIAKVPKFEAEEMLNAFPPGLDTLYWRMIDQIRKSRSAELCKNILALASVAYRPLTVDELKSFIDLPHNIVNDDEAMAVIIGRCGSFLTLRERTISLVHQSAKDFLHKKAQVEIIPCGIQDIHLTIFLRSLEVMASTLRRDIYKLGAPGHTIDQIQPPNPDPLAAARYSCTYWVDHLHDCSNSKNVKEDLRDGSELDGFLRQKYLYWLEALSLLKSMSNGMLAMAKLEDLVQGDTSQLAKMVRDGRRFIQYCKAIVEKAPLQVYASALIFSPSKSLTRIRFQSEEPKWITTKPIVEDNWGSCTQTFEHNGPVQSVAFSPDGTRIASGSDDNTVKIWDVQSGACLSTLEGHSTWVQSVAFSPDGTRIASGSGDKTVKIWDVQSGACLSTLEGHSDWVSSVAFSPDGTRIASGSGDNTVKIWDAQSGACLGTLEGHRDWVITVAFSPDGRRIASGSDDKTVKIWDVQSGACLSMLKLKGYSDSVWSVAFSPDSTRIASGLDDKTVRIWDVQSGACLSTLYGHSRLVRSVAFSPDGMRIASGSDDNTVKIWDAQSGACLGTLEGHCDWVITVTFLPDSTQIASGSDDMTVKIWNVQSSACLSTLKGHNHWVRSVAFSPDGTRIASGSDDKTVKIWNVQSSACLSTLKGHSEWVRSVAFSPDGTRIASGSYDMTVKIWDVQSGACLSTLEGHSTWVQSVAFSPDGTRIASGSDDKTVKIWDVQSGACLGTLEGHSDWVESVALLPDGTRIASGSDDKTVKIWDVQSGACLSTLEGHSTWVQSVAFSPDGTRIASGSGDKTVKIWDVQSGACLGTLEGHSDWVESVAFSPDGTRIASGSEETVRIWDVQSGACLGTLEGHGKSASSVFYSGDNTTNMWDIAQSWITWNQQEVLWLPPEYRPSTAAWSLNAIAIGSSSGRVWSICFSTGSYRYFIGN